MIKTFASLFTGGGLADIGAQMAGYSLLWGVELEPDIAAVANANLSHVDQVYAASVIGFDWSSVQKPDHLHMSPPCQDFSVAKSAGSKQSNPNDEIADACIAAIKALQPKTITLENVEGYRKAPGFQRIVDTLWGLGYWVNVDVLNSADFGVAQTRRRLFLRAVFGGFPGALPQPVAWRGWYEAIADLIPDLPETEFAPWQLERLSKISHLCHGTERKGPDYCELVRRSPELPCWTLKASDHKGLPKALLLSKDKGSYSDGHRWEAEPSVTVTANDEGRRRAFLIESKNANESAEPAFTIKASAGKQASRASRPDGKVVRITPRCLARFQSVPDWYVLPDSNRLACKIIGNGVPSVMMQGVLLTMEEPRHD
jgi:DNA (cytosine-5)-methyltransferase 1